MTKPLLLAVCAAFAVTACASAPQPRATAAADAKTPATASTKTANPGCITSTGSRIPRKEGECTAQAGRSFSKDDIDRTGSFSIAEALRRLDPSIGGGR
ncbi:MAG: hypothetical protein ABI885_04200 [Gammaproteobacteria bacterium]